jgi:predicted Fe-Mo cluster-binding NifX family protein
LNSSNKPSVLGNFVLIKTHGDMKAAIPTNDGIRMTRTFEQAKGFLIFDVELGQLANVEMIWNKAGYNDSAESFLQPLSGCAAAFAGDFNQDLAKVLRQKGIDPICTSDEIITNLIVHYIENDLRKASDCCCCP